MSILYHHTEAIHNLTAPREVVPMVMQMVKPKSVLDVGCGTGTWLKVFEEQGVQDYMGVDGSYLDKNMLKIPIGNFMVSDLRQSFFLLRKFDLVVSLEVAEHLEEKYADQFVQTLVTHGDIILFSAAIPGQGGQNHFNEQWPEYWEKKFGRHGFFFHDCIRPFIWKNERVDWWYRQNIFLVTKEKPKDHSNGIMPLVHPGLYHQIINQHSQYMESLKKGKQGLQSSIQIFGNALIHKYKTLLGWH